MTSRTPKIDFYAPKTLAVMDQAFAAIWNILKADDPFRDYAKDGELRIAVGQKLLNLVADGVTDPRRLRQLTVESLTRGTGELRSPAASISAACDLTAVAGMAFGRARVRKLSRLGRWGVRQAFKAWMPAARRYS